jgi:hypothetical protein
VLSVISLYAFASSSTVTLSIFSPEPLGGVDAPPRVVPILGGIGAGVIPPSIYYCLYRISQHRRGYSALKRLAGGPCKSADCDDPLVAERPGADAAAVCGEIPPVVVGHRVAFGLTPRRNS